MQNLKTLRRRIRSVQNTQKITQAMQMVAGAKLRRAHGELSDFRPYAGRLRGMVKRFLEAHPLLENRDISGNVPIPAPAGFIIITSDTGLCGTYNERILGVAGGFLRENPSAVVVTIGKKGARSLARRGIRRTKEILDWGGRYEAAKAAGLAQWMRELYFKAEVSSWWVVYTRFISTMRWKPVVERLLPVEWLSLEEAIPGASAHRPSTPGLPERIIVEPDPETVAEELLARFAAVEFRRLLLEAFTSEHSARMIAMKNATDNAAEMIQHLTLVRNKARQAAITKELIEVVSGAEALK